MYARFEHVSLSGMCAAVPEQTVKIADLIENMDKSGRFILKRVAALAGLSQRHLAPEDMFTGDLVLAAGESLLQNLRWDVDSVDMLFFASLSPDFLSPPTGFLVSARLGLSKKCAVIDLVSGCSGMLQSAWLASAQINSDCRRAVIFSGDAASKFIIKDDIGNSALMGDAVGALALEYSEKAAPLSFNLLSCPDIDFSLVNYGSGYRPSPGKPNGMVMDGNKITEFCLKWVPECLFQHLERENLNLDDIDIFFLHQPNKMILDTLKRRLKLDAAKVPVIFAEFANCSSASLPLSVCRARKDEDKPLKAMFCAFGSGLNVASMLAEWRPCMAFPIVELAKGALLNKLDNKNE